MILSKKVNSFIKFFFIRISILQRKFTETFLICNFNIMINFNKLNYLGADIIMECAIQAMLLLFISCSSQTLWKETCLSIPHHAFIVHIELDYIFSYDLLSCTTILDKLSNLEFPHAKTGLTPPSTPPPR